VTTTSNKRIAAALFLGHLAAVPIASSVAVRATPGPVEALSIAVDAHIYRQSTIWGRNESVS
jgi:hypothetical protein